MMNLYYNDLCEIALYKTAADDHSGEVEQSIGTQGGEDCMSKYTSYDEVKKEVSTLYSQKKHREAITLLESVLKQFPEEIHSTTYNLSILYMEEGRHERSMGILEYGEIQKNC